jgi:hypothetical protein
MNVLPNPLHTVSCISCHCLGVSNKHEVELQEPRSSDACT